MNELDYVIVGFLGIAAFLLFLIWVGYQTGKDTTIKRLNKKASQEAQEAQTEREELQAERTKIKADGELIGGKYLTLNKAHKNLLHEHSALQSANEELSTKSRTQVYNVNARIKSKEEIRAQYDIGFAAGLEHGRAENEQLQSKDIAKRVRSAMSSLTKNITSERCSNVLSINGYSQATLRKHVQKQFTDGMSWTNREEWHIDHIKPVSLWIAEGVTDLNIINALSNLKPIWAKDNLQKSASYDSATDHPVHVCPSVYA